MSVQLFLGKVSSDTHGADNKTRQQSSAVLRLSNVTSALSGLVACIVRWPVTY